MSTARAADPVALSVGQQAVLSRWRRGAVLVLGGPGSGKTTLLGVAATARLRSDEPPPLVLAAGRTAASHLRNLIAAALGAGSWQPTVTTVHALARTLWQRFSDRPELRLLAAPEQEFRVRELLAGGGPGRWPEELRHAVATRGFAAQVRLAIARARQLGLDPDQLVSLGEASGRADWVALGDFFAEYLDVLDAEGVLDYAELIHRVRLLLTDPKPAAALAAEVGAVLIDDYAELDPAQVALVASVAGGAPVLAAADPDSVTSGFRGADPRAIARFGTQFATPQRPVQFLSLEGSFRFGATIAEALARLRARLPRPVGVAVDAASPMAVTGEAEPGEVVVLACAGEAEQASAIAAELHAAQLTQSIDFGSMAVLVRSGRGQLAALQRALVAAGIPVEVAADEIPLAQATSVRPLLLGLALAARDQVEPEEAIRLLTSPLGGFDAIGLRRLVRQRRVGGATSEGSLAQQLAAAIDDEGWAGSAAAGVVGRRLAAVQALLARARAAVAAGQRVDEIAWLLWSGTPWPDRLRGEALAGGPASSRAHADLDAVCALFESAAEFGGPVGAAGVRAFLAEIADQQIPADREREGRPGRRGVEVLTAHRARGREWELVVVAGVQEGVWPGVRRRSSVLDATELGGDRLDGRTEYRELQAAERRLFHLACSRARQRLVVTASAGTEGEADAPSRFLAELGVPAQQPRPASTPTSLVALTAQLRRVATGAETAPGLVDAAAAELARLAEATDPSGRLLVPAADPVTWWGVRQLSGLPTPTAQRPLRLSPSQVASVLTCPRRYFLSRQAGAEAGTGLAATLGSLIHLLVQRVVTDSLTATQLQSSLDAAWQRLPFPARWLSASERVEVELGLLRFLNWRAARPDALVGVELPFSLELMAGGLPVLLEGKVDWLERTPEGLRVIDFKTSRITPTRAEVAGMEQLGIYQLAIEAGGFDAGEHQSVGAAAVYLRQPGKPEDTPSEFAQPSLRAVPYLSDDAAEREFPSWVHQRVAAAAEVVAEGRFPATGGPQCRSCAFATSCPASGRGGQVTP